MDPLRKAADALRGRKGVETRSAVMGESRVDFFRSKVLYDLTGAIAIAALLGCRVMEFVLQDFFRFLRKESNSSLLEDAVRSTFSPSLAGAKEPKKMVEEQIACLGARARCLPKACGGPGGPPSNVLCALSQTLLLKGGFISRADRFIKVRSKGAIPATKQLLPVLPRNSHDLPLGWSPCLPIRPPPREVP